MILTVQFTFSLTCMVSPFQFANNYFFCHEPFKNAKFSFERIFIMLILEWEFQLRVVCYDKCDVYFCVVSLVLRVSGVLLSSLDIDGKDSDVVDLCISPEPH